MSPEDKNYFSEKFNELADFFAICRDNAQTIDCGDSCGDDQQCVIIPDELADEFNAMNAAIYKEFIGKGYDDHQWNELLDSTGTSSRLIL